MSPLVARALDIAALHVGVREAGKNRGPVVEAYLARANAHPGDPWCAAFVYYCFSQAALELVMPCPVPRSASVHRMWIKAPTFQRGEPTVGSVVCWDHGHGRGHCGLVAEVGADWIFTIEGNTDDGGSREGDGVYKRSRRKDGVTLGYLDFSQGHDLLAYDDTGEIKVS